MGSRAVALVCRSLEAARARFGAPGDQLGAVWTRTGRPFFSGELTAQFVDRLRAAAEAAGLFDELGTPWLLLDGELLPWSAKAGQLLRDQYAAVGAAARASLPALSANFFSENLARKSPAIPFKSATSASLAPPGGTKSSASARIWIPRSAAWIRPRRTK